MAETGYTIPLSNANITTALQRSLNPDTVPQAGSNSLITSGGVKAALGDYMKKGTDYVTAGQKNGTILGNHATAEGYDTEASGESSHAEGNVSAARGSSSHAEGNASIASGVASHAEGDNTEASGNYSHAEGTASEATNAQAHAEGYMTKAVGQSSHAEGSSTQATGNYSHSEGSSTRVGGASAHAEGDSTRANGDYSHAEGRMAYATGTASHAEGNATTASGLTSHAQGQGTHATHRSQMSFGEYNVDDPSTAEASQRGTYVEIVGNGTSSNRSNARTLDWDGNETLAGKLTIGADPVGDMDGVPKKMLDAVAITDTASGSIASFSDGADGIPMRSVKAQIEPIQDLHGQASPYPEGGGKNKLAITVTTLTRSGVTFTILKDSANNIIGINANGTATANIVLGIGSKANLVEGASYILSGCPSGGGSSTYSLAVAAPYWTYDYGEGVTFINSGTTNEVRLQVVSGVTLSNLVFNPMIRLASETDATFASYSNICPIDGWTGAEATRAGVNLWDGVIESGVYDTSTGEKGGNVNYRRSKNYIPCEGGKDYYAKFPDVSGNVWILFWDKFGNYLGLDTRLNISASQVITTPANAGKMAFYTSKASDEFSFNYPSSDHDYHAYAGTTYPVTWESQAGTVYKGTAEYIGESKWKVKSDRTSASYSNGFAEHSSGRWYHNGLPEGTSTDEATRPLTLCNQATYRAAAGAAVGPYIQLGSAGFYMYRLTSTETIEEFNARIAVNPIQIVTVLATPIEFIINGPDPATLLGQNNVWSNTGDTEVEYVADPKLYVDKRITELFAALSQ